MGYAYRIYAENNLVYVEAHGRVLGAEVLRSAEEMFEDPDWRPGINQICDFRDVSGVVVSVDDMDALMSLERRYDGRIGAGKQALVVGNELHEMLCRLYIVMARIRRRPQTISVFRDFDQACAWIEGSV